MTMRSVRSGLQFGGALGFAYIVNVQALTWIGLGLSGWVFALDMVLLFVSLVALHRRGQMLLGPAHDAVAATVSVGVMILTAALIQQTYMVVYITFINPNWVDTVVEIREGLMASAGVAEPEIQLRSDAARRGFTPSGMLTRGLVIPALWKLTFALVVTLPMRTITRARRVSP